MAQVKFKRIVFTIHCECGKLFIAEDFEPQCPYCDRKYSIEMSAAPKKLKLDMSLVSETHT